MTTSGESADTRAGSGLAEGDPPRPPPGNTLPSSDAAQAARQGPRPAPGNTLPGPTPARPSFLSPAQPAALGAQHAGPSRAAQPAQPPAVQQPSRPPPADAAGASPATMGGQKRSRAASPEPDGVHSPPPAKLLRSGAHRVAALSAAAAVPITREAASEHGLPPASLASVQHAAGSAEPPAQPDSHSSPSVPAFRYFGCQHLT